MYIASDLLIFSFGFTMLKFISCYSDGSILDDQCGVIKINVNHFNIPPQTTEAPFEVDWTAEGNESRKVTLSATSDHFRGFMLDLRNCDGRFNFSLVAQDNNHLICGDRVMTQSNNLRKTSVSGLWTPESTRQCLFRAVFIKEFSMFWEKDFTVPSTTPPPTDSPTYSHSQSTVTPPSHPQCVQYLRCILALLLFSRMCFLRGSSLLIIIRPDLKKMAILNASVLELACKTVAVILVLIKTIKYECVYKCAGVQTVFTALTVAAMVSSLLHTITVSLRCGPSHELRKYWLYAIIIVDLMNTIITTTAIIFRTWCFEERWLPILMGVYVVWEIMLYLGLVCVEQMEKYQTRKKVGNQNHNLDKRISPRFFMFIIFTVFHVMLTIALMTGVSLVRIMN
ncbi:uncharacterized protein LOC125280578 isoform X2 [Megalobrama amblycephala]|uniref:uncharacterized protein LOC125280578 isoform X2 n=1 Tax=Megalobrama amblycephala TaxID=75352 RepID=UPI0020143804|nr:uncharacterized protein LOC125280578 isoform X2 [Megalobrama amblycephala]